MITLLVLAFVVLPVLFGLMELVMRLLGWTLSVVMSVHVLPLCLIDFLVGGIALLGKTLIPFLIVVFILSLVVPDSGRSL